MNYQKLMAMFWGGVAAIIMVIHKEYNYALYILLPLIAFAVGEQNGKKIAQQEAAPSISPGNEVA